MSTLPPVADPTASMPPASATAPAPAAPVSTLAPSAAAHPARSGRSPVLAAARPASVSQASTTTTTVKSSSKSKKKSGGNSASVTMATATTAQSGGGSGGGSNGENTGRWTAEEHNLFLQGLELHGKGWKKIAGLIKSRTVVQIRTHAQKYFQKLAKAKQNGEDVSMAGGSGSNGGVVAGSAMMMGDGGRSALNGGVGVNGAGSALASTSSSGAAHANAHASKRRKQTSGTKRKAIQSVVASARRLGNKKSAVTSTSRKTPHYEQASHGTGVAMNSVAPALSPYVLPTPLSTMVAQQSSANSGIATQSSQGAALEESLFRYLTPTPIVSPETQVNPVARQAGANPITLPTDQPGNANTLAVGESSPTGVNDLELYPGWTDFNKDAPTWYSKGNDVDALFDVADSLDWFADTGDLNETYEEAERMNATTVEAAPQASVFQVTESEPSKDAAPIGGESFYVSSNNTTGMSMNNLPRIDSGAVNVPPLPPLFADGAIDSGVDPAGSKNKLLHMTSAPSVTNLDEHIFSSPIDEQEFVNTILEENGSGSAVCLSGLAVAP